MRARTSTGKTWTQAQVVQPLIGHRIRCSCVRVVPNCQELPRIAKNCQELPRMTDLVADAWTLIFDQCARDTKGKHAVPALALVSTYRAVCSDARRGAAGVVTPFDAVISFARNGRTRVPVRFYGGVHFAERRYWAGLSIIRDAPTGQMFAVSHSRGRDTDTSTPNGKRIREYEVHRLYPLARLAQLLGGHESNPFLRLAPLGQYMNKAHPLWGFRNVPMAKGTDGNLGHSDVYGVMTKNQLRSMEWTGQPGPLEVHVQDFIAQRMMRTGRVGHSISHGDYILSVTETCHKRGVDRVEIVALSQCWSWYGPDCDVLANDNVEEEDRGVHVLSRALGFHCEARVAEGPGWLVSILTHGDPELSTQLNAHLSDDEINEMGDLARRQRRKADMAMARPYHPIGNPTGYHPTKQRGMAQRAKRSAAVVAQQRMLHSEAALFTPVPKRLAVVIDLTTTDGEGEETEGGEGEGGEAEDSGGSGRRRTRHSAPEPRRRRPMPTAAEAIEQFHAFLVSL